MDRRLLFAAFAALILEVTLLLADLQIIPLFESTSHRAQSRTIGEVMRTWQNVRRKGSDSIVWDHSQAQDTVFENDSVLTLAQSSAHIKLKGGIEVHIGENTLVVLEPADLNHADGTMKLKFSRGGLNARTQKQGLKVDHTDWEIEATSGTELNVQQSADGQVSLEVLKGTATVATETSRTQVKSGTQTQINGDTVAPPKQILETLSWEARKDQRLYTDDSQVSHAVAWQGDASELEVIWPDGKREIRDVKRQNIAELVFPLGTTHLKLANAEGVSRNLSMHIWATPHLYHFSPLPRDRILSEKSTLFTWSQHNSLVNYRWEAARDEAFTQIVTTQVGSSNRCQNAFSEGAYFWRVVGIDEEGFEIRPSLPSPIYSAPDPLAAPVLKKLQLRKPASQERPKSGASLWRWLVPPAYASDLWEAEFAWQDVPGADHYIIEISATPDFRNPLINTKVKKTTFIWPVSQLGRYYWRVAAGQGKRLGLFSPVSEAILSTETTDDENTITVRKVEPQKPLAPPEPIPVPEPEPVVPSAPAAVLAQPSPWHGEIAVGSGVTNSSFENEEPLKVKLNGTLPPSYALRLSHTHLIFEARLQPITWMDKANSDLQPKLPTNNWETSVLYASSSHWAWGLRAQSAAGFERESYEAVKLRTLWMYGPALQYETGETTRVRALVSLGAGDGLLGLGSRVALTHIFATHYFIRAEGDADFMKGASGERRELNLRIFVGWRW